MKDYTIYHTFNINATPEVIFQAISEPFHLVNWWPQKCNGQPTSGGLYNFYFAPEYDWYGEVSRIEPCSSFYIKMTKSDDDWNSTSFGFDLSPLDKAVQVNFWHKGWQEQNEHYKITSYCWAILLKGLKDYVEYGIIVPFEKRA